MNEEALKQVTESLVGKPVPPGNHVDGTEYHIRVINEDGRLLSGIGVDMGVVDGRVNVTVLKGIVTQVHSIG